ncbi:MAG: M23 family metallopeptidase [Elusimicrobiota bacterium]
MKRSDFLQRALGLLSAYALAGCSTAEKLGREALKITPKGRKYLNAFDRYSKLAHVFMKFHDKGNLDDGDVLDILYASGVLKTPPPKSKSKAPRKAEHKPFPVPTYSGAWRWPLEAGVVSSEFGPRWGGTHQGIDIAADKGTPIFAAAPGEVVYSGSGLRGYGNVVILRHDQDTTSIYAHNSKNFAQKGLNVAQGTRIAALGSTGHSTGPHLHFEIRKGNNPVPPRTLLPKSRF